MSKYLFYDKSTLVQQKVRCYQATTHYSNKCWLRLMWPYGITWPQQANTWSDAIFCKIALAISTDQHDILRNPPCSQKLWGTDIIFGRQYWAHLSGPKTSPDTMSLSPLWLKNWHKHWQWNVVNFHSIYLHLRWCDMIWGKRLYKIIKSKIWNEKHIKTCHYITVFANGIFRCSDDHTIAKLGT